MSNMILLAKLYDRNQRKTVANIIMSKLGGLKVHAEISNITERRWIQVSISGDDENAARHFLANEIGLCPENMDRIERNAIITGRIIDLNKDRDRLFVDVGVFSPVMVDAAVPLSHLQAQLVDGKKIALKAVTKLFDFCEDLPITIEISRIDKENQLLEGVLADKQLFQYQTWIQSLLDRLIILGVSSREVEYAIKATGSARDIVRTETLGLLEHVIECKLGTDAAGLIPRVGRILHSANFSVFSPRKIIQFLNA